MARDEAGLRQALSDLAALRQEFWRDVRIPAQTAFNPVLEKALRVADLLDFALVMCLDALERRESCGSHFRREHQTQEGEARRNDAEFCHAALWQWAGDDRPPTRHVEPLQFEAARPSERSYK